VVPNRHVVIFLSNLLKRLEHRPNNADSRNYASNAQTISLIIGNCILLVTRRDFQSGFVRGLLLGFQRTIAEASNDESCFVSRTKRCVFEGDVIFMGFK
jgi:hypothetical protein